MIMTINRGNLRIQRWLALLVVAIMAIGYTPGTDAQPGANAQPGTDTQLGTDTQREVPKSHRSRYVSPKQNTSYDRGRSVSPKQHTSNGEMLTSYRSLSDTLHGEVPKSHRSRYVSPKQNTSYGVKALPRGRLEISAQNSLPGYDRGMADGITIENKIQISNEVIAYSTNLNDVNDVSSVDEGNGLTGLLGTANGSTVDERSALIGLLSTADDVNKSIILETLTGVPHFYSFVKDGGNYVKMFELQIKVPVINPCQRVNKFDKIGLFEHEVKEAERDSMVNKANNIHKDYLNNKAEKYSFYYRNGYKVRQLELESKCRNGTNNEDKLWLFKMKKVSEATSKWVQYLGYIPITIDIGDDVDYSKPYMRPIAEDASPYGQIILVDAFETTQWLKDVLMEIWYRNRSKRFMRLDSADKYDPVFCNNRGIITLQIGGNKGVARYLSIDDEPTDKNPKGYKLFRAVQPVKSGFVTVDPNCEVTEIKPLDNIDDVKYDRFEEVKQRVGRGSCAVLVGERCENECFYLQKVGWFGYGKYEKYFVHFDTEYKESVV